MKTTLKTLRLSTLALMVIVFACEKIDIKRIMAVKTKAASDITATMASAKGEVIDLGDGMNDYGVYYSTTVNAKCGEKVSAGAPTGTGEFTVPLSGLTLGTKYYFCAYGSKNSTFVYGDEISFTTLGFASITTIAVTSITAATASSGGSITSDGGTTVISRGICWSTSPNPTTALTTKTTDGSGMGNFTSSITRLTATTLYYVRAYATNRMGTAYGNEISFTTVEIPTNGLVAYYPFNGNSNDESVSGYTGINHGATLITDRFGIQDKAYSFNGSSWINCGNSTNLQISSNITICFWLKTSNPGFAFPVQKIDIMNHIGWMFGFVDSGTQNIYFECVDGTFRDYLSSPNTKDNNWHFIVGQREGTILRIFKDGTKTGEVDKITLGNTNSSGFGLELGYQYSGLLDDVRIFNRALSASEINTLFHEGSWN